jgi:uncharacterized protein RhaS with RHS repeats
LYYNHNRYYNPELGRYMEPDPTGLEAGLNPYAYAGNNPVNNTDETGLYWTGSGTYIPDFNANDFRGSNNITFGGVDTGGRLNLSNLSFNLGSFPLVLQPKLTINHLTPSNAINLNIGGVSFPAPPTINLQAQFQSGQNAGRIASAISLASPAASASAFGVAVNSAEGQFGKYDYQRDKTTNQFNGAYTPIANIGVGVYMNGTGASLEQTIAIGSAYAIGFSSSKTSQLIPLWIRGWNYAQSTFR